MKDKPMIDRVTAFTQACEEITEELTRAAGIVTTRVTPLLSPLASGLCVLFAFYDGGGRLLDGKVGNPYLVSFLVGLVLLAVVEGINFSAIFNRDRGEKLRVQYPDQLAFLKLNNLVNWCFVLTIATVGTLETLPGAVAWYVGELSAADLGFRIGLLVLPIFSRMGASIFSASMVLDALEGTGEARRQRRLQEKREAAELEIELEEKRQQSMLRSANQQAEFAQRLELERLKAKAKLNGTPGRIAKSQHDIGRPEVQYRTPLLNSITDQNNDIDAILNSTSDTLLNSDQAPALDPVARMQEGRRRKVEERRNAILDLLRSTELGIGDLATRMNVSENTIRGDLQVLQSLGHQMSVNGMVKLNN